VGRKSNYPMGKARHRREAAVWKALAAALRHSSRNWNKLPLRTYGLLWCFQQWFQCSSSPAVRYPSFQPHTGQSL